MADEVTARSYRWDAEGQQQELKLVWVPGTGREPYLFGREPSRKRVHVPGFFIAATPVTQALWTHVMGANPCVNSGPPCPREQTSWRDITQPGGFLDRVNHQLLTAIAADDPHLRFRLPSETEWEYAARGGPHWRDDFAFSGSNDPDEVAWYGPRWGRADQALVRLLGWRAGWRLANRVRKLLPRRTRTHPVGVKAPNQLGLYDMSGNIWEWCEDVCTDDLGAVPVDGRPYLGAGPDRRLRGGCHHNWDLHCRVFWRYGIESDAQDRCIGFRVVLGAPRPPLTSPHEHRSDPS
jgi:sulfatase modifying factor 1